MDGLALIFAVARNHVIGRGGKLPWSYPEDRARYEAITHGHAVIMGRRTWEELGVPLVGRHDVVVSKTIGALPREVHVASDLAAAIAFARTLDPCPFVIGGVRLFEEALPRATRLYVTEIPESPDGDTFFSFDESPFRETSRETTPSGLVFRVLDRS